MPMIRITCYHIHANLTVNGSSTKFCMFEGKFSFLREREEGRKKERERNIDVKYCLHNELVEWRTEFLS